jgi:hypothetical protein
MLGKLGCCVAAIDRMPMGEIERKIGVFEHGQHRPTQPANQISTPTVARDKSVRGQPLQTD